MSVFYMHTIEGPPAYYVPGKQICFITHFGTAGMLAHSLKQIREERALSVKYRQEAGIGEDGSRYGYKRVRTPSVSDTTNGAGDG